MEPFSGRRADEPPGHPGSGAVRCRRGTRVRPPAGYGPGRAAQVASVEAAIWAETISGFDDLCFLLLPRLAGAAHKAWSVPRYAGWADHRDRLARQGRLWAQDDLTYFRTSAVDWL